MSVSELGALVKCKPDEAKGKILAALKEAKGDRKAAADILDTTHRSFYRFIERLRLWDEIDQLMDDGGFPRIPGPPRSAKKIRDAILTAEGDLPKAARILETKVDALRGRISELGIWEELNRVLAAAKLPKIKRVAA